MAFHREEQDKPTCSSICLYSEWKCRGFQ